MKIDPNNYPYPFLSEDNDNYINAEFSAEATSIKLNEKTGHFDIDMEVVLDNKGLEELIVQGYLTLSIHVESPSTYYNQVFDVSQDEVKLSIDNSKVANRLELNAILTVKRPILHYINEDFHPDYQGLGFHLIPGNIIGAAPAGEIIIDQKIPEKVESIFVLRKGTNLKPGELNAEYRANKIAIYISEKDHKNYQRIQADKKLRPVLYSLVVVPVLIDTIHYINSINSSEDRNEMQELDWFKSIQEKLDDLGIDFDEGNKIKDPIKIASNLIDNTLEDALTALIESGEENE